MFAISVSYVASTTVLRLTRLLSLLRFQHSLMSCNLGSSFYFCYPFAVKSMFAMVFLYYIFVGCFSKTKESVFILVIHQLTCLIPNSSAGAFCKFLNVSSSVPFKAWASKNLGIRVLSLMVYIKMILQSHLVTTGLGDILTSLAMAEI